MCHCCLLSNFTCFNDVFCVWGTKKIILRIFRRFYVCFIKSLNSCDEKTILKWLSMKLKWKIIYIFLHNNCEFELKKYEFISLINTTKNVLRKLDKIQILTVFIFLKNMYGMVPLLRNAKIFNFTPAPVTKFVLNMKNFNIHRKKSSTTSPCELLNTWTTPI